jgi:hypothetical protein
MAPHLLVGFSKTWNNGQTIRVAFKGGSADLHKAIADTVSEWTQFANLTLDFGLTPQGTYRAWAPADTTFSAEIRVSFDQEGYYSLVGTDSIDTTLTKPGEESLNLQGFDQQLPNNWKGTALHEFGHALGFQHEHQASAAACDFRFQDDPGYVATTDDMGQYVQDSAGRKPGLYTYLGGPPNNWPKAVVDFNLRPLPDSSAYLVGGVFDKDSIMKYYFPDWFFVSGTHSQCFTGGEATDLSPGDKAGAAKVYPRADADIRAATARQLQALEAVTNTPGLAPQTQRSFQDKLRSVKPQ